MLSNWCPGTQKCEHLVHHPRWQIHLRKVLTAVAKQESVCVRVCTRLCLYVCMCVCDVSYTRVCMCACMWARVCACVCMCMHVCVHTAHMCVRVCVVCVQTRVDVCGYGVYGVCGHVCACV